MSAEDLQNLEAEAAAVDAGNAEGAQPGAQPGAEGEAKGGEFMPAAEALAGAEKEAGTLLELIAAGVHKFFPVLEYTPEVKAEAARRVAPLMLKYDLAGTFAARWADEIRAGIFFGGLVYGSVQAVRADREQKAKAEAEKNGGQ